MLNKFFGQFSKDIGIDLGTANTLVFVRERGIVIHEPSIVAINTRTDQILAVGHEAKDMLGKTPPHILTVRPLSKGVISDFEVTEKMLKYFIDKVHEETFTIVPRPRVVIGVPLEITEVERKAVEDAALSAGARQVFLVEEPLLAGIGGKLPIAESRGSMIVDIGGGTTKIAVISLAGVVNWKTISTAGDELTKNIIQYAREAFNLFLGERVAEQVKIQIGTATPVEERLQMAMRGRDLISGLPKEMIVYDSQIRDALQRSVRTIIESIKATLEVTPPELAADIYERGIYLTGGGGLLRGFDEVISKETSIRVNRIDDPITAIARGAGALLDDADLLKEITLPSATGK